MLELGLNEVLISPESHQQQFEPVVDYDIWPEETEKEVEKKYQMPDPSIRHQASEERPIGGTGKYNLNFIDW